ncbi:hypothetical protein QYF36_019603 [Acer negundo]|nr:hypothetical protein QYF36_019603 [Acer negundo]
MNPARMEPANVCHIVALPYPGRGHINPMMNLCKLLASRQPEILITFVVTEEWLGFIGSEPKPDNIQFGTIPNVKPSELSRAKDFSGFVEAVATKTEAPFEELLDRFEYQEYSGSFALANVCFCVFDFASFSPPGKKNGHFPVELSERGHEIVDYIPGLPPTRLANLPTIFYQTSKQNLHRALEGVGEVSKAHYLFFTSVYELEAQVIDSLLAEFPFPVYAIRPAIPYSQLNQSVSPASPTTSLNSPNYYLQWTHKILYFGRAKDFSGFLEAVSIKTEAPFEELLDRFEYQTTSFALDNVCFCVFNSPPFSPPGKKGHFPVELSERGHETVDYIPRLPPTRLENLPTILYQTSKQNLQRVLECVGEVSKAQYLFFTSLYELEAQVIDSLKAEFPFPVYTIGPAIPYFQVLNQSASAASTATSLINTPNYYLQRLDSQPAGSVFKEARKALLEERPCTNNSTITALISVEWKI